MGIKDFKMDNTGKIQNVAMLDLRSMSSAESFKKITSIENVGLIIIPENSDEFNIAFDGITMKNVGNILALPKNARISQMSGQVKIGGEALSNANGSPDDILLMMGQIIITSPIQKIGFGRLIISGQLIAPKESQGLLGSVSVTINGQLIYYAGQNPRIIMSDETYSKEFFELLEDPIYIVVMGDLRIESDVTKDLLKQKVSGITLMGDLKAPKALIPLLQVLTTDKMGDIRAI